MHLSLFLCTGSWYKRPLVFLGCLWLTSLTWTCRSTSAGKDSAATTLPWELWQFFALHIYMKKGIMFVFFIVFFLQLPSFLHGVRDKRSLHQASSVTGADVGDQYPQPVWVWTAEGCRPKFWSKVSFLLLTQRATWVIFWTSYYIRNIIETNLFLLKSLSMM